MNESHPDPPSVHAHYTESGDGAGHGSLQLLDADPVYAQLVGPRQRVHPPVLPALAGPGDLRRVHTRRPGAVARRTTLPRLAQGSVTASAVPGMMRASVKKYSSTQRTDALACRRNGAA